MVKRVCVAALAATVLVGTWTKSARAIEVPLNKGSSYLGMGFTFFCSADAEPRSGELIVRCGMRFIGYPLTTNEARLRGNGSRVEIPLSKTGKSGLEAKGVAVFVRNGKQVNWQFRGQVRNRNVTSVKPIQVSKSGKLNVGGVSTHRPNWPKVPTPPKPPIKIPVRLPKPKFPF